MGDSTETPHKIRERGESVLLKKIHMDRLPNGQLVTIPEKVDERNFEQQIKRFIEIADYNPFDGQLHISFFRTCHGGEWTLKILAAVLEELRTPSIELDIEQERSKLLPFFEAQLQRHRGLDDTSFRFDGKKPVLPI